MREEFTFFTEGKRGCVCGIEVTVYPKAIVAMSEKDRISLAMLRRTLLRVFPHHSFAPVDVGDYFLRVDAKRWAGDGAWEVADSFKEAANEL